MTTLSPEHFGEHFGEHLGYWAADHPQVTACRRRDMSGAGLGVGAVATRRKTCGSCGVVDDQLKKCGVCKAVWYCNVDHQKQHWGEHSPFCVPADKPETGAVAKNKNGKKNKKKTRETNFNIDTAGLYEVASLGANQNPNMQFQGNCGNGLLHGQSRGRRKSPMPDLSTPIDSALLQKPPRQDPRHPRSSTCRTPWVQSP
ncbi:hypothetical protein GWK47_004895 [Chionoecetes opilio]|uniref:MYND-type domain-containing protein n=1 Tax=Chionoecetes opilio TaxID=41210 RepID=A0A8J5CLG5_CHIOP|nr:hypothetical protein GWK47_004895 [Chionoecetes opilio]